MGGFEAVKMYIHQALLLNVLNLSLALEWTNKKIRKKRFFAAAILHPYFNKSSQIWDQVFPLLFPKDSKNLTSFDIELQEMGAKIPLKGVRNTDTKKNPAQ